MSCRIKTLSGRVSGGARNGILSPLCPVQIRPELVKLTEETSTAAEIHLLIIIVFRLLFKGYSPYTMKRAFPWDEQVDVISSDDSSSSDMEMETNIESDSKQLTNNTTSDQPAKERTSEGALARRAEMYQEYMKQIPIPAHRGSVIPFTSWMGLGKSIKQLYGQPLHYLTNILLKQWDQLRMGSEEEYRPLDTIIHPCKAEATIWLMEEVHRHTSSHYHIANLWLSDPMHHAFVDSIFPQLRSKS